MDFRANDTGDFYHSYDIWQRNDFYPCEEEKEKERLEDEYSNSLDEQQWWDVDVPCSVGDVFVKGGLLCAILATFGAFIMSPFFPTISFVLHAPSAIAASVCLFVLKTICTSDYTCSFSTCGSYIAGGLAVNWICVGLGLLYFCWRKCCMGGNLPPPTAVISSSNVDSSAHGQQTELPAIGDEAKQVQQTNETEETHDTSESHYLEIETSQNDVTVASTVA